MSGRLGLHAGLPFTLEIPTRIQFGRGVRSSLGETVAPYGRRAALVTGTSFGANPAAAGIREQLHSVGLTVLETIAKPGEPDVDQVLELAGWLTAAEADVVVAVGGGSVIDLVKAAALLPDGSKLSRWLGGERVVTAIGLPVVAMPTTAGSGAEVSHGAIILDRLAHRKRGVRGPGVAAAVALVDPDLTVSAASQITAASGFDAVAHSVETGASRAASDLVVHLAGIALGYLLEAIPAAMAHPDDAAARERAAYGALLMGLNLAMSTTCLPHRLQYPVGAVTSTPHAVGVAALMPAWLRRTQVAAPEMLGRVGIAAGLAPTWSTGSEAAGALVDAVEKHLDVTGMRTSLGELGLNRSDIPALIAAVEGSVGNDPGPVGAGELARLYELSL